MTVADDFQACWIELHSMSHAATYQAVRLLPGLPVDASVPVGCVAAAGVVIKPCPVSVQPTHC